MLSLDEVKTYLRVDNNDDDDLITTLMSASNDYLRSAVDKFDTTVASMTEKGNSEWLKKVDVCRMLLISDWYENRLAKERPVSASVSLLIAQLQVDGDTE